MYALLLAIIYLAFVSLGLPDPLLGAAWPVMYGQLGVSVSSAGVISMIIAGGTIVSSLMSDRLTRRLGTGLVTAVSVLMSAIALFGFSQSGSFAALCLWGIPYGLGAGAVDAALNNYVALHYSSRHMNWLHSFWGVGTSVSPYIMGACLTRGWGWNSGYLIVSVLQAVLAVAVFFSLPLWKKRPSAEDLVDKATSRRLADLLRIRGAKFVMLTFFGYCALEGTAGLWASSYLAEYRGVDSETAAQFASLFYLGITFGRLVCGFVSDRMGDRRMIRTGLAVMAVGTVCVMLPVGGNTPALAGLVLIGLGCAPVYPSIIHSTPANFGEENSQAMVGIQMASAYMGATFMPPLFGALSSWFTLGIYPLYLAAFIVLMLGMSERLNASAGKTVK